MAGPGHAVSGPDGAGFWTEYQPGFRFSDKPVGSREFFAEVELHRYALEPHIPELVRFERWAGADVLEAGCGIATDGARFARAGARYTGLDQSETALELATRRFREEGLEGSFERGSVTALPFEAASFDLVYSHGVIHHLPETERAVEEFERVLRPGGVALVMVYHRDSLNYRFNIMVVRRFLAASLAIPGAVGAVAAATGEDRSVLEGHRRLLREHGPRYLTDAQLFLSNNTDGPGNPLSKVYSRDEAQGLFAAFDRVESTVRFLNLRLFPGGDRLAATGLARRLERRWGWHLYVSATKSAATESRNLSGR
jgi:SAM-dependent methyltransferase